MVLLAAGHAVFLILLSLGMAFVLGLSPGLPGRSSGRGRPLLVLHLCTYLFPLGLDIPFYFSGGRGLVPAVARAIALAAPACFWSGPTLLWFGRSLADKSPVAPRHIAACLAALAAVDAAAIFFPGALQRETLFGVTTYNLLVLLWTAGHAFAALVHLRGSPGPDRVFSASLVAFLASAAGLRTALTALSDPSLGFSIGLASIPVFLLIAQSGIALSQRTRDAGSRRRSLRAWAVSRGLSRREEQVLREVCGGAGNKDVALRLGISENTVKRHMGSIFRKCGASSRFDLASMARGWGEGRAPDPDGGPSDGGTPRGEGLADSQASSSSR